MNYIYKSTNHLAVIHNDVPFVLPMRKENIDLSNITNFFPTVCYDNYHYALGFTDVMGEEGPLYYDTKGTPRDGVYTITASGAYRYDKKAGVYVLITPLSDLYHNLGHQLYLPNLDVYTTPFEVLAELKETTGDTNDTAELHAGAVYRAMSRFIPIKDVTYLNFKTDTAAEIQIPTTGLGTHPLERHLPSYYH